MMLPQTYGVTDPYLQERLANHVYTFRMYQRVAYMLERRGTRYNTCIIPTAGEDPFEGGRVDGLSAAGPHKQPMAVKLG